MCDPSWTRPAQLQPGSPARKICCESLGQDTRCVKTWLACDWRPRALILAVLVLAACGTTIDTTFDDAADHGSSPQGTPERSDRSGVARDRRDARGGRDLDRRCPQRSPGVTCGCRGAHRGRRRGDRFTASGRRASRAAGRRADTRALTPTLRRLRGVVLRLTFDRRVAVLVGVALVLPAVALATGDYPWETWVSDGCGLVAGATGVAVLVIGLGGRRPDWVDTDDLDQSSS